LLEQIGPEARLVAAAVESPAAPGALPEAVAAQDGAAVLESSGYDPQEGRYTVLACQPLEVLTLRGGLLRDAAGTVLACTSEEIWAVLHRAMAPLAPPAAGLPYAPGWIGYVGYEVGRHVERLPGKAPRDTHLPDLHLAFYDSLLVYDALRKRWDLVEIRFDRPPAGAGRSAETLRGLAAAASPASGGTEESAPAAKPLAQAAGQFTPAEYRRAVARCVEYIAAGDIFQVNLSQRFTVCPAPSPPAIYRRLRRRNPAWYSAYLQLACPGGPPCAVVSSSPELFLRLRGRRVVTRPIKGTRARTGDDAADAAAAADLWNSPKDNAELAMIVDLLRNDLGRVCRFGTVRVAEPRRLETHPTVLHLSGAVEGLVRQDVGPAELLRATFPGGSITGAPKIRAMEIIDELEPAARGVYTGCIGHVGADGSCTWNIAIRTVVCDGPAAHVQVGGGIVADSTPQGEYQETLDKARAMLEAIAMAGAPAGG